MPHAYNKWRNTYSRKFTKTRRFVDLVKNNESMTLEIWPDPVLPLSQAHSDRRFTLSRYGWNRTPTHTLLLKGYDISLEGKRQHHFPSPPAPGCKDWIPDDCIWDVQIIVEINEMKNRKAKTINEIKSWLFEKINKIDKPLIGLNTGMRE